MGQIFFSGTDCLFFTSYEAGENFKMKNFLGTIHCLKKYTFKAYLQNWSSVFNKIFFITAYNSK